MTTRAEARLLSRILRIGLLLAVLGQIAWSFRPAPSRALTDEARVGQELYQANCSTCHGLDGLGTENGPSLAEVGPASVDFMLSTGRMPLANPADQPRRGEPKFSPERDRRDRRLRRGARPRGRADPHRRHEPGRPRARRRALPRELRRMPRRRRIGRLGRRGADRPLPDGARPGADRRSDPRGAGRDAPLRPRDPRPERRGFDRRAISCGSGRTPTRAGCRSDASAPSPRGWSRS